MRGKDAHRQRLDNPNRITPAYAGKREVLLYEEEVIRDHPRLCGEKLFLSIDHILTTGSPPPMRGKVIVVAADDGQTRITPAYAGKSN